jgi:hypothetical protein
MHLIVIKDSLLADVFKETRMGNGKHKKVDRKIGDRGRKNPKKKER